MPFFPSPCALLARQFVPVVTACAATLKTDCLLDCGPVFLPPLAGINVLQWSENAENKLRWQVPLAVSCFALSQLAAEALTARLDAMHNSVRFVLLADFKVAERNIEAPACLLMGGIKRLTSPLSSRFSSCGGLEGLLYEERKRFAVRERHTLLGGALTCLLAECLP